MLSQSDLHHYQERAAEFIKAERRCGLGLEMGLGKSVSTLTAIVDLIDQFVVNKVIIIAPLRVANSVWKQEAAKWTHLNHLRVNVCTGTERQRLTALMGGADCYVINRENVSWLVKHFGSKWPFDMVVIDESSSFKSPSSQRFKSLKRVITETNYTVLLTGTPAPNGLLDLWAQQYLIDYGTSLGRTMTAYKQRFFEQDYSGYRFTPRAGADTKIHELIADKWLMMQAQDYLELPERIMLESIVELPDLDAYKQFERDLLIELPEGEEVEAPSAAALANKLLQWSNGAVYVDELHNWNSIHDAKLDALEELIETNEGENILIAYNYKHDLERLKARFPTAVMLDTKQQTIDDWNNGRIRLLLAHPASAGHGINLQHGGSIIIWFGLNWSLELYQQFNARLHRQGQERPVRIVHIITKDTIDERVMKVLAMKDAVQNDLIRALK